jgi:hypothetical protein
MKLKKKKTQVAYSMNLVYGDFSYRDMYLKFFRVLTDSVVVESCITITLWFLPLIFHLKHLLSLLFLNLKFRDLKKNATTYPPPLLSAMRCADFERVRIVHVTEISSTLRVSEYICMQISPIMYEFMNVRSFLFYFFFMSAGFWIFKLT